MVFLLSTLLRMFWRCFCPRQPAHSLVQAPPVPASPPKVVEGKTCDIQGTMQNMVWVAPVGGGRRIRPCDPLSSFIC
jgi:hypothetical protein